MDSNGSIHQSMNYPHQRPSSQFHQSSTNYAQPNIVNSHGNDYFIPNTQPKPSQLTYFSPQSAFYNSSNQAPSSIETLANNPLLHAGFNIVEQSMKDVAGKAANTLPNQVKKSLLSIKYYFAVDQTYVFNKLCLLLFPFRSRNWSVGYSADEPVPPKVDTNAPDYYIPLMSAMTYVLIAGLVLGIQNKFNPEQLGMHATSALVWNIIEIIILCLTFYIFNIRSKLRTLDLIAYCGYKYVGMNVALSSYLLTHSLFIYRCMLLYASISLSYFLMKCLRLQILPDVEGSQVHNTNGNTRRIYLLLFIILIQPLFIWYLTRHLIVA